MCKILSFPLQDNEIVEEKIVKIGPRVLFSI